MGLWRISIRLLILLFRAVMIWRVRGLGFFLALARTGVRREQDAEFLETVK